MQSYNDISILACFLALDHDVITIADVILNHRASTNNQSVSILSVNEARANIHRLESVRVDIEWLASSNIALYRDALLTGRGNEFNSTALLGLTRNPTFLFQHGEVVIN